MGLSNLLERIRLDHGSRWINDDVRPVEAQRRTWTFMTYHNLWLLINCNLATFLTGSALIPLGLTWWQAIICIVIGNLLATIALILSSLAGAYYHIGFPVFSRAVWGMHGAQFTIWNRIFLAFVWYGFQSWVGGQCIYLVLLSFDPKLEQHVPNHMSESTGMTTAQFLAYVVFCLISLPPIWIKPHKLEKFFYFSSSITLVFFIVLLIWSLATMGPDGFGDTLSSHSSIPVTGGPYSTVWLMISGIMTTIGSIAAGILNQNDWARLSRKPRDAIWGQIVAFPVYGIFASVLGILVTAATQRRMGEPVWNPLDLFARLLEMDNSAGTRAALFFAGSALAVSQIGSNLPGDALSGGMDIASIFPKYINIRRGAYIVAIMSPIVNPWKLVNTATVFLTVLSSYSIFLAPMTGMMAANYIVVSRGKIHVDDLFRGDENSIYWYTMGFNWRAPISWVIGVAPCLPGFIAAVNTSVKVPESATEFYYLNYLYGFLVGGFVYSLLHWIFPNAKLASFVRDSSSAKELQHLYDGRWAITTAEEPSVCDSVTGEGTGKGMEAETVNV